MEYRILGPMEVVTDGGQHVPLSPRSAKLLAALLLSPGRAVALHELVDAVWDDDPPSTARRQIHNCVWQLRRAIEIVADRHGYRIPVMPGQLDAQRFESAVRRAQHLAGSGQLRQASDLLTSALRLWRGPAIQGCQSGPLQAAAARIDEMRLTATEQRAELELTLGQFGHVTGELTELVAAHPLREPLAGLLMRALDGSGRRADALAVYQRLRAQLATELGIDPSAGLQQLHLTLLGPAATALAQEARKIPRRWALPPRSAHFTGRKMELDRLTQAHGRGRAPDVVTLWGLAGTGKTCLAAEYTHRVLPTYALVAWIPAVRRDTAMAALTALGHELGLSAGNPEDLALRTLSELDKWAPWLLIYDDADPHTAKSLLPTHGHGDVLITSRNGEWSCVGETIEVGLLPHDEAVAFMLTQSADGSPGAAEQAGLLVHRLGRLPAAISLAGAYCHNTCSIAEYRGLLVREGLKLLRSKHSPPTEDANEVAIRLSASRIVSPDGAAFQLLTLLAWFAPGYLPQSTISEHAAVLPQPLRETAADPLRWRHCVFQLQAAGLIRADAGRLWNHELVQEVHRLHATTAAPDHGMVQTARAWRSVVLRLVAADFPANWNDTVVWEHCTALLPHATAVLDDAMLTEAILGALPDRVTCFYLGRGLYSHALGLSQRTHELRSDLLGQEHPLTLRAMNYMAMASHRLGRYEAATFLHQQELELSRQVLGPKDPGTLASMNNLARALDSIGEYAAASDLHRQTLDTRRRIHGALHPETLSSLNNLGNVMLRMRDVDAARQTHEAAFQQRRRTLGPHQVGTLQSMNNLANVMYTQGDHSAARKLHQETARIRESLLGLHHPDTLISLNNLANALHGQGDHQSASQLHRRVLTTRFLMHGADNPQVLRSMSNLAAALLALGEHSQATELRQRSLEGRCRILGPAHPDTLASMHEGDDLPDPTPNNAEDIK